MENKRIAEILYNLACDMDYMDHAENMEDEINQIETILSWNIENATNLKPLYDLLVRIAEINENTRDFVGEIRDFLN